MDKFTAKTFGLLVNDGDYNIHEIAQKARDDVVEVKWACELVHIVE